MDDVFKKFNENFKLIINNHLSFKIPEADFLVHKISFEPNYNYELIKSKKISLHNIDKILNYTANIEDDLQYSFMINGSIPFYDNKTTGGRFSYNIFNGVNSYKHNNFKLYLKIFSLNTITIDPIQKIFFSMGILILVKHIISKSQQNQIPKILEAIEGVIIKKNKTKNKINLYVDTNMDLSTEELKELSTLLKCVFVIHPKTTIQYTSNYEKKIEML